MLVTLWLLEGYRCGAKIALVSVVLCQGLGVTGGGGGPQSTMRLGQYPEKLMGR
jgi:hypothetical protein